MKLSWPNETLHVGMPRRATVGGAAVDVEFRRPLPDERSMSLETIRLGEDLMAATLGLPRADVRVAPLAPSGRPVAMVRGRTFPSMLTLSHVPGLIGAAVFRERAVGIDIVDPATVTSAVDVWFRPSETAAREEDSDLRRVLVWSAKEAAYKASRLDTEFRPREIVVDVVSGERFSWFMEGRHRAVQGTGAYFLAAGHVVAIAAVDAHVRPEALAHPRRPLTECATCS